MSLTCFLWEVLLFHRIPPFLRHGIFRAFTSVHIVRYSGYLSKAALAYAKLTSQGMLKIWTEVGVDSNIMISFSYPVAD